VAEWNRDSGLVFCDFRDLDKSKYLLAGKGVHDAGFHAHKSVRAAVAGLGL